MIYDHEMVKLSLRCQVKLTDMQVRGAPRTLLPGEPLCAPSPAVLTESLLSLLRALHAHKQWRSSVNKEILASLSNVNSLVKVIMTLAAAQEGDRSEEAGEERGEEDDQREDGDESGKLGEAGECCHLEDNDQPSPTTSEKSGGCFFCGVFFL